MSGSGLDMMLSVLTKGPDGFDPFGSAGGTPPLELVKGFFIGLVRAHEAPKAGVLADNLDKALTQGDLPAMVAVIRDPDNADILREVTAQLRAFGQGRALPAPAVPDDDVRQCPECKCTGVTSYFRLL